MASGMPQLGRGEYLAVQRALKSIWYGEPAPIAEAADHEGVSRESVEGALADYINLLTRALPHVPVSIKTADAWQTTRIMDRLTAEIDMHRQDQPRLDSLRREAAAGEQWRARIEEGARKAQERVTSMQQHVKRLETRERSLRQQIERLEPVVRALAAVLGETEEIPA